jgi:NRPS condensation-like uncharacterized protein
MTKQEFTNIKAYAKNKGVTINDLMITAYARVLFRQTGKQRVIIPCPVDLRRYLHPGQKYGICNLTGNYICDVLVRECDSFDAVLSQIVKQMQMQKSSQNCLKPVMMLELGFRILPFRMLQKVFHKAFSIPVISFSNLGVIDKKLLNFDDAIITYAYLTGTVKSVPYFQIAVSTYDDICTLSSNQYGTAKDEAVIKQFLIEVRNELVFSKPSVETT